MTIKYILKRGLQIISAIIIIFIALFVIASFTSLLSIPGEEKILNGEKRNQALYIEMSDGVKLAVDIWFPSNLQKGQKIPTIMHSTRYGRAYEVGPLQRGLHAFGITSLANKLPILPAKVLNENGYALVMVDVRGTGASYGLHDNEWNRNEVKDYGEVIDWISKQKWSNGKVGTIGVSYAGNTAELASVSNHPALKIIAPLYNDFDPQYGLVQPGGVINKYIDMWSAQVSMMDQNDICGLAESEGFNCFITKLSVPGVKPVDEDSSRELLKAAVAEHKENAIIGDNMKSVVFRDDTIGKTAYQMKDISPFGMVDKIESSAVPMIIWSGWLDAATSDGTLSRFLTFSNKQQVVIGPYSHGGYFDTNPYLEASTPVSPSPEGQLLKKIEIFDKFLKEEDTYSMNSSILYFTMGENVWRGTNIWPPDYVENVAYYFNKDNVLSQNKPSEIEGSDSYEVDFTTTTGMQNRWFTNMHGDDVVYLDRKEEDKKLLNYTTPILESDVEITGSIIVKLQVSSTYNDGAFFAYLEDVAPNGRVTYITEGMLRALHRKISDDPEPYVMIGPNHSFNKKDAMPLVPGEVSEIKFKLFATSVQIKKGHRIRISLAGADDSIFSRFPKKGTPVWQVQRNTNHISSVTFPMRK